jgi:hypothetical protein
MRYSDITRNSVNTWIVLPMGGFFILLVVVFVVVGRFLVASACLWLRLQSTPARSFIIVVIVVVGW